MNDLYHLAYISKNTIGGENEEVKSQIENILATAQANNPSVGVTGALLYSGGYFLSLIHI